MKVRNCQLEEDRRRAAHVAGDAAQQARVLHRLHEELLGSSVDADGGQCRAPGDGWTAAGPGIGPGVPTSSPESGTIWDAPAKIMQATYSAPLSSRILVEAGFSSFWTEWGDIRPAGAAVDQIAVTEQSHDRRARRSRISSITGGRPRRRRSSRTRNYRAALSYVTGSHSLKVGYQGAYMVAKTPTLRRPADQLPLQQRRPEPADAAPRPDAHQQPHRARRVLRPGPVDARPADAAGRPPLRARAQLLPRGRERRRRGAPLRTGVHVPAHRRRDAATTTSRRAWAASYDLFGNGKTALKVSMSKYLQAAYQRRRLHHQQPGGHAGADDEPRLGTDCGQRPTSSPTATS